MGGGLPFPLLNYSSVYLLSTLNHYSPTQPEGHTLTNTCVCVCVQRNKDIFSSLLRTFHQVIFCQSGYRNGKDRCAKNTPHTNTHTHTHTHINQSINQSVSQLINQSTFIYIRALHTPKGDLKSRAKNNRNKNKIK